MTRRVVIAGIVAGALVIVTVAAWLIQRAEDVSPSADEFPARASAKYNDGSSTTKFKSVGEIVATADLAVEGKVLEVDRGSPVRLPDGSGEEIVPRIIRVEVLTVFHRRGGPATQAPPTVVEVTDGYWEDGVGYERESVGWATPGQVGFFLLSRDRAADGSLLATYSPLDGGNGIALIEAGEVEYAHHGVWHSLGQRPGPAKFRDALERGAAAARSGGAKPVPVTICYPSDPGDENSDPICEEK